jgi:serine/threonine protein phosphatase PrpC
MRLALAARTHPGCRRRQNQDEVLVRQGLGRHGTWALLAVADGMGGAAEGGRASREAVRVLALELERWQDGKPDDALHAAFEAANLALIDLSKQRRSYRGMGTTLVAALTNGREAWIANVGDSRAYQLGPGFIRQVTEDHSLVAEQVRAGYLDEREAAASPHKNIITRSLGHSPSLDVDVFGPVELRTDEGLLLCSDGLHAVVGEPEMAAQTVAFEPDEAAEKLIALANEQGSPDNVSVIVARVE